MPVKGRTHAMDAEVADTNVRVDFYERIAAHNAGPLWKVLAGLVPPEPRPKAAAYRWQYQHLRPFLLEACGLISAEEAERRVLVLENPNLLGLSRATDSLFCGLQIIMPGETAPAHRHVASALRFILEGRDTYTAVDGERTMMAPGDFVITPSWVWHHHENIGDGPMVWVDGLDMHIVNLFNASFREERGELSHEITRPDDSSIPEFGHGMAPATQAGSRNPMLNYTYARADEALNSMAAHSAPDPHLGHILKYLNPLNGDWAIPTMATHMRRLPAGFSTQPYRATDSTVFVVVNGEGTSRIGNEEFSWSPLDIFVAPSWALQQHQASSEATIFTYSDRAVQEKLGLWRDHRAEA